MKKFAIAAMTLVLAMATNPAAAHERHHGGGWGWVGPAVIGTVIGYEMARSAPVYQPPVYAPQPQVIYQPAPVYMPQPEVRTMPRYSPTYPAPNGCVPVYTAQGQFYGCVR